jgi:hypothetical protein
MGYFKASQKANELTKLRMEGWISGTSTGIEPLDEIYTMKKGYPLFIAGAPGSGKTELMCEIMLNASKLRRERCFCYFGESGDVEEIIADLAFKFIGKPYKSKSDYSMSEAERMQAEQHIDEYFVFLDDEKDYTIEEFYKEVERAENEYGIKFDTTIFDPFNDLIDQTEKHNGRDDKWLAHALKLARRSSKENKRIDVLITHTADIKPIQDKETQKFYLPPALPSQWALGRTWWRRAFCMIMTYRPPEWLRDENGIPYGDNVSLIFIQKAKPKGVAKIGSCKILWDWKKNRYYWKDEFGDQKNIYGTERKSERLTPLKSFTEPARSEDAPF